MTDNKADAGTKAKTKAPTIKALNAQLQTTNLEVEKLKSTLNSFLLANATTTGDTQEDENEQPVVLEILHMNDKLKPQQAHPGDAGLDVFVRCWCDPSSGQAIQTERVEDVNVNAGGRVLIKTGVFANIPKGYEVQVRPRSGLALWDGLTIVNSPGTVDAGYKGEIGVILLNTSKKPFVLKVNMKIAQLVVAQVPEVEIRYVNRLTNSSRGEGGYNSTGN